MHRRALRASATATVAAAIALCGTALALAPSAMAVDDSRQMTLSVDAPTQIGFAGGPVEFTETFGNTGTTFVPENLWLSAEAGKALFPDSLTIDYQAADGHWKPLDLTYNDKFGVFGGKTTETFSVAPGTTRTVHLRIGVPMGTPHHGDTNGGTDHVTLTSALVPEGELIADVDHTDTIKVTPVTSTLVGVPVSATAGGSPIEFGAKVTNPTPSVYTNLSHVLFADKYATVQVFKDGRWTTLSSVDNPAAGLEQGFYLDKNATFPANGSAVTQVRLSYRADHPAGHAQLMDCLIVNEQPGKPFESGTTMCQPQTTLYVTDGSGATPTPTPSATATATATPTPTSTTAAPAPAAQLAETGSGSTASTAGLAAGALLLGGGATMASVRLRRRSH